MSDLIDFDGLPVLPKGYDGANGGKICVLHEGREYMLKFPAHARCNEALSYANDVVSEHIGCSIFRSIGIDAQETILGTRTTSSGKVSLVVACRDFTENDTLRFQDFAAIKNQTIPGTPLSGYGVELEEIDEAFEMQRFIDPQTVRQHFWDMFVADAFIGN